MTTLDRKELQVTESWDKTGIHDSVIQCRDRETSNGTIHSPDKVIWN